MTVCRLCSQALTIELDSDSFDEATSSSVGQPQTAPDDLLLACGCHFHWQCLLDESPQIALDLACPACSNAIVTPRPGPSATNTLLPPSNPEPQILARYHNEGGIQPNLDILPLITEEAYLDANPGHRPARAFMTMCAEGDVSGIVELLKDLDEDEDESMRPGEVIRWQDPLEEGRTGLHVAVEKGQEEVVWLLLWVGSGNETGVFPGEVVSAAETMGAERRLGGDGDDVRGLKDEAERTPGDVAREMGSTWAGLVGAGVLG
ncbi:uncharacterized protein LY89DRAFT_783015 [Mollisia scopiformis]|uniref:Uncharacterized protein n=1 Tax=Mollisia scopiformis TaxID=149040 RepID=A0A194X6D0_MOLSC|nr:uncharacterized protein LY89DRAFT_783015 [Mollisia scopiformis]KUJ15741.1 hypothetical protein LY89DRAFT_783015 [Mollisia scopiformis]